MNRDMVEGINARVAPDDDLYILGDYSFKMTAEAAVELRDRINCRNVHLIPGNHDKDWTQPAVAGTFIVEPPILKLNIHGQKAHLVPLSAYGLALDGARQLAFARARPQQRHGVQRA